MGKHRGPLSFEEECVIKEYIRQGYTTTQIQVKTGRSRNSINDIRHEIGVKPIRHQTKITDAIRSSVINNYKANMKHPENAVAVGIGEATVKRIIKQYENQVLEEKQLEIMNENNELPPKPPKPPIPPEEKDDALFMIESGLKTALEGIRMLRGTL